MTLSVKNYVNLHSKSNKQKTLLKKLFFVCILKVTYERVGSGAGSGSISERHGSADPDPHQNFINPEHWLSGS
jgi:hypothetical protein